MGVASKNKMHFVLKTSRQAKVNLQMYFVFFLYCVDVKMEGAFHTVLLITVSSSVPHDCRQMQGQ